MSDFATDVINMSRFGFNRIQEGSDDGEGSSAIGFNRHSKLMSPDTRALVLKSRATEIEAFAEDRGYNPQIVMGIAEAVMRLGRVPALAQYGFSGDDAKAIKHFMSGEVLNLAIEETPTGEPVTEATGSGGMGGLMSLNSRSFMTRGNMLGMEQYARTAEEQKALKIQPRLGCDPSHKTALTMDDINAIGERKAAQALQEEEELAEGKKRGLRVIKAGHKKKGMAWGQSGSPERGRLSKIQHDASSSFKRGKKHDKESRDYNEFRRDESPDETAAKRKVAEKKERAARNAAKRPVAEGLDGKGKNGTALSKKLRGEGKAITSPAERRAGEFEHASGGTAGPPMTTSTKGRRIREDDEVRWVPGQGLVIEGEKTRAQRKKENKAAFAKLSPKAKAATQGNAPFHPSLK